MLSLIGRPKVQHARITVEEPLPRLIEFFEDIKEIESLVLAETVEAVRRGGLYEALLDIEQGHLLVRFRPVVGPVTVNPDIICFPPVPRPVTTVVESAR